MVSGPRADSRERRRPGVSGLAGVSGTLVHGVLCPLRARPYLCFTGHLQNFDLFWVHTASKALYEKSIIRLGRHGRPIGLGGPLIRMPHAWCVRITTGRRNHWSLGTGDCSRPGPFRGNLRRRTLADGDCPVRRFRQPTLDGEQQNCWSSSNGIRWTGRPKTDWGERAGMAYAFFAGRFWMLGGMRSWDDFRNDVWSSTNGTEWSQVTPHAAWPARRNHAVAVFNNNFG